MTTSPTSFSRTSITSAWPAEGNRPWLTLRADWLAHAAVLPGKTLHVGLAVWASAAETQCPHVLFVRERWAIFGLSRDCVYDALTRLADAGLVLVDRGRGHFPVVSLLDRHGHYLTPRGLPSTACDIAQAGT